MATVLQLNSLADSIVRLPQEARRLAGVRRALATQVQRLGWIPEVKEAWEATEKALSKLREANEHSLKIWAMLQQRGKVGQPTFVKISMPVWTDKHYEPFIQGLGSFLTDALVVLAVAAGFVLAFKVFFAGFIFVAGFLAIASLALAAFKAYIDFMEFATNATTKVMAMGRDPKDLPINNRNGGTGIGTAITNVGTLAVIGIGLLLASQLVGRK